MEPKNILVRELDSETRVNKKAETVRRRWPWYEILDMLKRARDHFGYVEAFRKSF